MKTRIISGILSTFLVIMFFSCKEKPKTVLYQGFVVGLNGVPVYKKPADYGHKISVLPVDAQFEVLEEKIPDPKLKDKRYWYEIRSGESRGYLSYNEVLINKNVSIFSQAGTKNVALITAKGGLNLRQKPGLKAKVIKVLPTNSLVEVIKQGSFMQAIKDKYDRWLEIKTTTGETGFIFAGYVNLYTKEEAELASKRKETQDSGYILITVDSPVYYENPGKDPINPENKEFQGEGMNYKGFPQKGEFGVVKSMVELAGKKYFKIEMVEFINYSDMYSQAMGWISADSGTYYSEEDFETYTLKNAGEFESGFINLVKTSIEGDINFTETKLTP
ncbi:MAG: SH3 domain-containing protein, partial [Leptospiraceae bacterium]|nr:SH3 domain-containing protein [Leptospiraceae bacterium]